MQSCASTRRGAGIGLRGLMGWIETEGMWASYAVMVWISSWAGFKYDRTERKREKSGFMVR